MPLPKQHRFASLSPHGFHQVSYREWGDAANPRVVVCVHGLTRNGRDFDFLGAALQHNFRVICPDMPGRGDSEWLRDPHDYVFPTYLGVLTTMLAHARADSVAWVGTSMGGLLGMAMAAQSGSPVARMVCNDVGPVIGREALARIGGYVGLDPVFHSFEALDAHVRQVSAPFGRLTDEQWTALSSSTARTAADGTWRLNYDPGIAVPFADIANQPNDLWPLWDAIACPTLVLRGAHSDLLSEETAAEMGTRGPRAGVVTIPDVGHAPMLLSAEQIAPVVAFLEAV